MTKNKLTKADIDKVRHIEGFPLGKDEDIIALSAPPYYTACPNPFIEDFISEHGMPYDEATDDYHSEPFAADVSEGKNDPIYNAHSYHTKVPHKAIMRYILHYTKPGDIVFDGFCGTGMTGVAAQMCGSPDPDFKFRIESEMPEVEWGARKAILSDLSPAATFIAYNYNTPVDVDAFRQEAERILAEVEKECGWMYETRHVVEGKPQTGLDGKPQMGRINYTVWSEVLICSNCGEENIYWDISADLEKGTITPQGYCKACNSRMLKRECPRSFDMQHDILLGKAVSLVKFVPVLINYSHSSRRFEKTPDEQDLDALEKIRTTHSPHWIPHNEIRPGDKTDDPERLGILHVHQMYTRRNVKTLAAVNSRVTMPKMKFALTATMTRLSKMNKFTMDRKMGVFSGTLIIPSLHIESSPFNTLKRKIKDILKAEFLTDTPKMIQCGSMVNLANMPDNCCDYIFTDPPFGDNINYSELNYVWESWLKIVTNIKTESIVSPKQNKRMPEYQHLMESSFNEYYRVLKPNRWITVEFHNSRNAVWNSIMEAIQKAGFIIADVRILDKQQSSYNQVRGATQAIKQDLVISAYKPKSSFKHAFIEQAGSEETAWAFVRQHLENLPIAIVKQSGIEVITERQAFLLFDRMVAYHMMNGIPVPLDAPDFFQGLNENFLERDGMYFLCDQVNTYDNARMTTEIEPIQFALGVTNEKTAIAWLYQQLGESKQTYGELQPKFMQECKTVDKFEQMPELSVMLDDSFLQDEKGRWYVPDITKSADVAKLREKKLVREFESYLETTGKLRKFRTEAIRAGFAKLWADNNFELIVKTADRLPEKVIAEDEKLLIFVTLSSERI